MRKKIRITGMDPAFRNWGSVQADYLNGSLSLRSLELMSTKKSLDKKIKRSVDDLNSARILYDFYQSELLETDILITELPTGSQSATAAKAYGVAIGILSTTSVPYVGVSPMDVKLNSVGHKNASKDEMIDWAIDLYPDLNWKTYKRNGKILYSKANEHLADAIAVIHAGIATEEFQKLIKHV